MSSEPSLSLSFPLTHFLSLSLFFFLLFSFFLSFSFSLSLSLSFSLSLFLSLFLSSGSVQQKPQILLKKFAFYFFCVLLLGSFLIFCFTFICFSCKYTIFRYELYYKHDKEMDSQTISFTLTVPDVLSVFRCNCNFQTYNFGVVRCDAMWCDLVGCVAMRCDVVWFGGKWWDPVPCGAMRCDLMWCGAIWCDAVRFGGMRCNVVQCGSALTLGLEN